MAPLEPSNTESEIMDKQDLSMMKMSESSTTKMEVERSVSFSPYASLRETIHIDNYTNEEISACWYDSVELKMVKVDNKNTLLLMANVFFINDRICSRGLESYTQTGQASKRQHREDAIDAAIDEQDFQMDEGITDPEMIAEAYFERTRQSQAMARVMGLSDQETVRNQEQQRPLVLQKIPNQKKLVRRGSTGMVNRRGSSGRRQIFSSPAA
jgi:hypothetical protein